MSTYSYRITTNGVMRNYRSNLMKSYGKLNTAMERIQTGREYNAYYEDPTSAMRAFQLRRSIWRTEDALSNTNNTIGIFETAFSIVSSICDGDSEDPGLSGIKDMLELLNDPTGSGRNALGQTLSTTADSIVQMMNGTYGGNFIFAGADGHNVPFTWDGDNLCYRGVRVDTPDPALIEDLKSELGSDEDAEAAFAQKYGVTYEYAQENYPKLQAMAAETTYVDIGIGFEEDADGIVDTSAYNTALSGLNFLGYGVDEDGDPLNVVSILKELSEIALRCDRDTGAYAEGDEETAQRLGLKLADAIDRVSEKHVELSAKTTYLNLNVELLTSTRDNLDTQRADLEDVDQAMAITEMSWAQYCYNAALKIGNDVLSNSLIDYLS